MLRSIVAVLAVAIGVPALAQESARDARPGTDPLRPPALLVRPDPDKPSRPLRVASATVEVRIAGGVASTRLDLTFVNDLERILEGEVVLPLPRGATVSHFALEVGGALRAASVVEREKARVVYETVVRQQIDPGLVEWAAGNAFRTRVYPIPAKGTKRLVLGYQQALPDAGGGAARYVLPLDFGGPLDAFHADVTVYGSAGKPAFAGGAADSETRDDAEFTRYSTRGEGGVRPADLVVTVPLPAGAPEVAIEPARDGAGDFVFVARVPVPEPGGAAAPPEDVTVLWDASGSMAARDLAKERAFLEAYLRATKPARARLVVFSNDVWDGAGGVFDVADGRCDALLDRLAKIRPDGGTDLACLDRLRVETDRFLLFSDGMQTFGDEAARLAGAPVVCVTSAATADWRALARLGVRGAAIDLREVSTDEAVRRALAEPRAVVRARADAARVRDLYPAAPARIEGRVATIAGRLTAGGPTTLTLELTGGATASVVLDPARASDSGIVERAWASAAIEATDDEREVVRIAKAYGMVTPYTSLLVLDRLEDYVRHRVPPPPELAEQYAAAVRAQEEAKARSREERLARVRAMWERRVAWWETTFVYAEDFRWVNAREKESEGGTEGHLLDDAPAPSAAPAPMEEDEARSLAREANGGPQRQRAIMRPEAKTKDGGGGDEDVQSIALEPWDPSTPYLAAMKKAETPEALYAVYLDQRDIYRESTSFFLDCADHFLARGLPALALRALSNLAELKIESAPLLRILAYRLKQMGHARLAIATFRAVARIRPEEPQTWRDLGLALADVGDFAGAATNLERVVTGDWDGRFPEIEAIALGELNDVLRRAAAALGAEAAARLHGLPADLVKPLDWDLRIVLGWDADACDMDLWVVEPSGEKAFYGHTQTTIGGLCSRDFTGGYGPEEYLVRRAMKGTFKVHVNYYGNRQQTLAGETTIQVTIIKNYGRPDEVRQEVTRRLGEAKEVLDIAEVTFP